MCGYYCLPAALGDVARDGIKDLQYISVRKVFKLTKAVTVPGARRFRRLQHQRGPSTASPT